MCVFVCTSGRTLSLPVYMYVCSPHIASVICIHVCAPDFVCARIRALAHARALFSPFFPSVSLYMCVYLEHEYLN